MSATFCIAERTLEERDIMGMSASRSLSGPRSSQYSLSASRSEVSRMERIGEWAPDESEWLRRDSVSGSVPWPLSFDSRQSPAKRDSCSAMASVEIGINDCCSGAIPPWRDSTPTTRAKRPMVTWAPMTQVTIHPSLWCALFGYRSGVLAL